MNYSPLLLFVLEWKDELKRWEKSRKRLKKAVKKAHAKVEKKLKKLERRGPRPDESGEQFGNRLLNKQDKISKKIFKQRRTRLTGLQDRETTHFDDYVSADRVRREREARPRAIKMRPIRRD